MSRPAHRTSAPKTPQAGTPQAGVGQPAARSGDIRSGRAGARWAAAACALALATMTLMPASPAFAQGAGSDKPAATPAPVQQAPAPSPAPAQQEQPTTPAQPAPRQTPQAEAQPPAAQPQAKELVLVVLGDSLSAGYNLPGDKAFPAVLEKALQVRGHQVKVVNAGVSGDTTTGGLERLDWSVPDNASGVIVELGANDMLRGIDPAIPRDALDKIVTRLKQRNIPVLLAGMRAAPNLGGRYSNDFESIYQDLAKRHNLTLYPFFLDGVAGDRNLLLPDGMHPNPVGVQMMVSKILPTVEQFLTSLRPQ